MSGWRGIHSSGVPTSRLSTSVGCAFSFDLRSDGISMEPIDMVVRGCSGLSREHLGNRAGVRDILGEIREAAAETHGLEYSIRSLQ